MARQVYTINNYDHWYARRWIEKKLDNPAWLANNRTYPARQALKYVKDDALSLNDWCQNWLKKEQWKQMKNAIRAARKRSHGVETKTVTLTHAAWFILDYHAQQNQCTLSEVIERKLSQSACLSTIDQAEINQSEVQPDESISGESRPQEQSLE